MDIRNRWTGKVIESSKDDETLRQAVQRIVRERDLSDANLRDADLRAANLSAANLRDADLRDADLSDANLRYADLRAANLSDADLRYADLRYADLSDANLRDADLRYADLSDANLRDADLRAKQYVARIRGRRHEINIINGDVRIGCIRKPIAEWLECYEAVGAEAGYTAFEIAEYGLHLRHIDAVLKLWATAEENVEKEAPANAQ